METLKNVNKHLSEVFKQISTKDIALGSVADDLRRVASKVGEAFGESLGLIILGVDRRPRGHGKYA